MSGEWLKHRHLPKLLGLVVVCVFFVTIEGVARVAEQKSRLDTILEVLEEDSELWWKQRADLDVEFFGGALTTDARGWRPVVGAGAGTGETAGGSHVEPYRILVLGASPSFGWGVDDAQTYASRVQQMADRERPGRVEVTNGASIAYSSRQGLALLDQTLARFTPDLVTVSFVINDVDGFRFFRNDGRPDAELEPTKPLAVAFRNGVRRSAFARVLAGWLTTARQKQPAPVDAPDFALVAGPNRVSEADYRKNLLAFDERARKFGFELVWVLMPVNLPLGPPALDPVKAAASLAEGKRAYAEGDCARAVAALDAALQADPVLGEAHYYLARCAQVASQPEVAERHFAAVKECENHKCARDALRYNQVMREVAAETGRRLVDVVSAFASAERGYLYVDPKTDTFHPNSTGHQIIAEQLYGAIAPLLKP
ncbi:MAG: GDSL-type esterase/lipase family protein [Myxococcota bacterium]